MSWIDDSQGAVKPGDSPTEFVVQGKPRSGTPVNARFSAPITPGENYFEVDVINVKEGAFIGITTLASFKKGWGCNGLLFGRNLSSGGALVREGFGEDVTSGSTVGVLTEFIGDGAVRQVQVTFWQNGKCLGPAFLSNMKDPAAEVFAVVHTNGEGDRFNIRFALPAPDMGASAPAAPPADPRVGRWFLQSLRVGPDLGEFPLFERLDVGGGRSFATPGSEPEGVYLNIEAGSTLGEFSFSWRVVNRCNMTVVSSAAPSLAPFDKLQPSQVASTMMMGDDGPMEVETQMAQGMEALSKWIFADGALLLNGPTVEMEFTPAGGGGGGGDLPAKEVDL